MEPTKKHLLTFLKDWLEWTDADSPVLKLRYLKSAGICYSLARYFGKHMSEDQYPHYSAVDELMQKLFFEEFGKYTAYPFGGRDEYMQREKTRTMHLCPNRLGWVRRTITALEGEVDE